MVYCYSFKSNGFTGVNINGVRIYDKKLKENPTYKKGNTLKDTVTSTQKTAYPNDGYQDGLWYVYKGLE